MAIPLKQSTAAQEIVLGPFVDSTDGNSAESGLTINASDIKLWKNTASTLANKNSGGASSISSTHYYLATLDATDTDTLGPMVIFVHVAGALPVRLECMVLTAANFDAAVNGSASFNAQVTGIDANAITATSIASNAFTAAKFASGAFDAVWSVATRLLTAGTNIVLAKGTGVTGFNDLSAANVNAEVVDALATDTYAEPGQGAPAATTTLAAKINYLYKAWRNKSTQTASTYSLFADDASTVDQKATVSDDDTTATRGEIETGP